MNATGRRNTSIFDAPPSASETDNFPQAHLGWAVSLVVLGYILASHSMYYGLSHFLEARDPQSSSEYKIPHGGPFGITPS